MSFYKSELSAKNYINREYKLLEAFAKGSSMKVMEKLTSYLSRKIKQPLFLTPKSLNYENSYGKFSGYLCIIGDGKRAFRINFLLGKSDYIASIDYYNKISNKPTLTVEFDKNDNIVQIAESIESILRGNLDLSESIAKLSNTLKERKSFAQDVFSKWVGDSKQKQFNKDILTNERITDVYSNYFEPWADDQGERLMSKAAFIKASKDFLSKEGLKNKYARSGIVKKASGEKDIVDKKEDSKFNKEFQLTVDEKYEQIDSFVDLLSNGFANGFIITGSPGIGKSHSVLDRLKKVGLQYTYTSGAVKSAKDFYKYLYYHREGEILVLDDIDDILINKSSQNILKAVLDTNVNKPNIVSYLDKDFKNPEEMELLGPKMKEKAIPNEFEFSSGIIFISNLTPRKLNKAVLSRSLFVDLHLTKEEILDRIDDKIEDFPPQVPVNIKKEVLDFFREFIDLIKNIDFRMFDKITTLRMTNHPAWKKWSLSMIT